MLDFLIRNWLHNTARQKMYEAARQAAGEHFHSSTETSDQQAEPARDKPCEIGLVLSPAVAAGALEDRLSGVITTYAGGLKFRQGGLGGRHIALVEAGTEPAAARRAAELLIAGHRPQWIISAGFAVGLQAEVQRGDFLLANEICSGSGQSLSIDLQLPPSDPARSPRVYAERLFSAHPGPQRPAEKESCGLKHSALAADEHSFVVADVCRHAKTRFLAVHVIRDRVQDEPPRDLKRATGKPDRAARWGATLGALVHRPSTLKEVFDRQTDDLERADRLARFLEGVVVQLPPATPNTQPNIAIEPATS